MVDDLDRFCGLSGLMLSSREDGLDVEILPNLLPGSLVTGRSSFAVETGLENLRDGVPERGV